MVAGGALSSLVLIPAIAELAKVIGDKGAEWISNVSEWTADNLGFEVTSFDSAADLAAGTHDPVMSPDATHAADIFSGDRMPPELLKAPLFAMRHNARPRRIRAIVCVIQTEKIT